MTREPTAPALRVEGLVKRFGATVALDGVDLTLKPGEVHALIGENGAGKSTLLNVVAGAIRPDRGRMFVAGEPYTPGSPLDAKRRGIALIHQELMLCPHLTVAENVVLGAEPRTRAGRFDAGAARARASALLRNFDHPEIDPDERVGRLPLAARQVVEICRALAADVRVLLMDEPTSSFQRPDIERLFVLIRRLASRGIGVVYISHFLEEVREIADRYTVVRDGRSLVEGRIDETTNDALIEQMVGRSMGGHFPRRAASAAQDVLLEVDHLAAPPAVRDASFTLRRGEILGIAGLIGSGRTELVRALFGLDRPVSGRITLAGRPLPLAGAGTPQRLSQGFGFLSEDRKGEGLALPMSVTDNLTATRLSASVRRWGILDVARQRKHAGHWIAHLGIRARSPAQPVRTLSGGNQQKVVLGRLLYQKADVLLLDEPTRGIDVGSRSQMYEAIAGVAAEGKAVLMVSSYLPELFGMCDRLAVMSRGRLSEARPIAEWTPGAVLAASIGGADIPVAHESSSLTPSTP